MAQEPITTKKITLDTGETFTFDFYCERRGCYMTFLGCERLQAAAEREAAQKRISAYSMRPITEENKCIGCEQGAQIAKTGKQKQYQPEGKTTPCLWPGCDQPIVSTGLCQTHIQRVKRNTLIRINTAAAGPGPLRAFLQRLAKISKERGMPIEDVALACLDEGINVYFQRMKGK